MQTTAENNLFPDKTFAKVLYRITHWCSGKLRSVYSLG